MRNLLFLTVALASGVLPLGVLGSPARVASWLESASNPSGAERAGIRIRTFFQPHQNCSAAVCFCERAGQAMVSFDDKTSTERPCTEEEILTPAKREFAEEHVQMAVDWLADALLVSPVKASLPVVVDTCGIVASRGAVVPSDHHNPGVPDADFVLYVTFVPDVGASQAWALACQEDQSGRPTAGLVNFAPTRIDPDSRGTTTAHNWMLTVVHELMHALGFADHRFEDAGWFPESPIPSGAASEKDADGITRIKTPNVVAKAREHFNCSDIDGVALENQGGTGTALSHWEKRILGNEIMTGVVTNEAAVVSAMTLAYFEDTGVYGVNYSTAGNLLYGKNRGCGFLTKACDALVADDGVTEFCFSRDSLQPTDTGCSFSGLGYGPCNVVTYGEDLPEAWQYYPGNPRVGGGLALPDYCPFVVPVVMCREQGSAVAATCKTQAAAEACGAVVGCVWDGAACLGAKEDVQGEGFSANSRCFFGSTVRNGWTASSSKARCLSVVCHAGGDGYTVTVDGHSLSCTAEQAGSPATASDPAAFTASWSGAVTCQPVALICDGSIATAPPTPAPPPETGSPPVAPVALSAAADEEDPMSPVLMLAIAGGAAFIAVCIAAVGYAYASLQDRLFFTKVERRRVKSVASFYNKLVGESIRSTSF
ncbi:Leishmanolysin-like protein [Diplonema papillatum]|nr:Leishmanolysin-like protein [Diplonema papillatum]